MIKTTVGTAPTNSVVLNHPSVSPFHLEIVQDDAGNFLLSDLSSAYGTFVNGYRIQGVVQLRNTDIVMAGQITLPWQNYFMYSSNPAANTGNTIPPVGNVTTPPQYGTAPVTNSIPPVKKSKKKILFFVGGGIVLLVGIILTVLYFYTKPSYAHLKYIPSNALVVTSVNFKSIAGKIDLDKLQKLDFFLDMKDQARGENEAMAKAMGDPLTTGIDIFSQPYAFVCADKGDYGAQYSGGIVFSIKNESDFHDFVHRLSKDEEIENSDNFHYLKLGGDACLAWNSKGGIFYFSDRSNSRRENYCRSLLEQDESESILSNENFETFRKSSYDIGFFINYSGLYSIPDLNLPSYYRGSSSMATITFNDGKLSYASEYFPSKDQSAANLAAFMSTKGINDELKNSIPGKSYGVATISVNMKTIYDMLTKDPRTSDALDELAKEFKLDRTQLAGILSGDAYFSLADVKQTTKLTYDYDYYDYEYESEEEPTFKTRMDTVVTPVIIFGVTAKDTKILDDIIKQAEPKDSSGIRYFNPYFSDPYYVARHNSNYFITNDFGIAKDLTNNGKSGAPLDPKMSSSISMMPMYSYFNMNLSKYPAILPKYFQKEMGERQYPSFKIFTDMLDYAELNGDGTKQTLDIYFTDKGNCLNTFFKVGNDIYVAERR
jgi:hypothetical protein